MDRTPGFETSTGFLLSQLGVAATRSWTALLAERDLTPHHHAVLLMLRQFGPLGLTELAQAAQIDPRNMGPILDPLERRGIVARTSHPTDRRRRPIALTPAGEAAAGELATAAAEIEAALLEPLTASERDRLRGLLLKLWR
jgi:DNA-binding MarR family transcriptional regulator